MAINIFRYNKAKSLPMDNDTKDGVNLAERSEFRGNVSMSTTSQSGLKLPGGITARGSIAIVAIVVIFIAYYFYSYLAQ